MTIVPTFAAAPDEAYARYLEIGWAVEPDVMAPETCERLIAAAQRLPTALDGSYLPVMQVHRADPIFFEAMRTPKIVAIIERLVHGRPAGLQTQFYFTPPARAGLGCHQDNYFVEAPDDAFASAWVPLVDVTPDNGGLYFFRGSHRPGKLPVREVNATGLDKRQAVYEETVVPEGFPKIDVFASRGAAVFIHGYAVHGSHQNRSATNRYALLNTYIRSGAPFRPGRTARREEVALEAAS